MSLLAYYEHKAALAIHNHATAVRVKDNLSARLKAMEKEREALNHPASLTPLGERAAKLAKIESSLSLLQTELRLSRRSVEQCEVKITETKLILQNSQITARNLSNRIALAEQQLEKLLSSDIPRPSIELFRARAERDLAALREQSTQLVGGEATPLEAA
jgi:hypothetical protein